MIKQQIKEFKERYGSSTAWIAGKIGIDRSILSTYLSDTAKRELNISQIIKIEEGWNNFKSTLEEKL